MKKNISITILLVLFATICFAQITEQSKSNSLLFEGFEGATFPPAGWSVYKQNGALDGWTRTTGNVFSGSYSASHWHVDGLQKSWLVTPAIEIPTSGYFVLDVWSRIRSEEYYTESNILISTVSPDPASGTFSLVKNLTGNEVQEIWQKLTLPLNDYLGETIYIAFQYATKYFNYLGGFYTGHLWLIDDVNILELTSPAFSGSSTLQGGIIYNNIPNKLKYTIKNVGGQPLTVNAISSSPEITVKNLPLTIPPTSEQTITIEVNASGFPVGAYNGQFKIATNDPNHATVTVNVSANVQIGHISPFMMETFNNCTGIPSGWTTSNFFLEQYNGMLFTPCLRAELPLLFNQGSVQTSYVAMGNNPSISFYYRALRSLYGDFAAAAANSLSFNVLISADYGETWEEVLKVQPGQHISTTNYRNIYIPLSSNYANQICMVKINFTSHLAIYELHVTIDNVDVGTVDYELEALLIKGSYFPEIHKPNDYKVSVRNNGRKTLIASDYTVKLMRDGGVELASLPGVTIAHGETKTLTLTWTPDVEERVDLYGEVLLENDLIPENNRTGDRVAYVVSDNTLEVFIGDDEYTDNTKYWVPINFNSWMSISQTLYLPHEMKYSNCIINGLRYKSHLVTHGQCGDRLDKEITIWLGETEVTDLTDGWIQPSLLTKVFEGKVDFFEGDGVETGIPFTTPYHYQGGTLVVYVYKDDLRYCFVAGLGFYQEFYHTVYNQAVNRVRSNHGSNYFIDDPMNPSGDLARENCVPNISFYIDSQGMGSITGMVTNGATGEPLEGVKLSVELFTANTDIAGKYTFPYLNPGQYEITASKIGFFDTNITVEVIAGEIIAQNIMLAPRNAHNISGLATDTSENPLEDVTIFITGYADYKTKTDELGNFSIPGVYEGFLYKLSAVKPGYEAHVTEIQVDENIIHNFTLDEIPCPEHAPVRRVLARIEDENCVVEWTPPSCRSEFRYDSGTNQGDCVGWLGLSTRHSLLGSVYKVNALLTKMAWYSVPVPENINVTEFDLWVFGLQPNGQPDRKSLIFNAQNVSVTHGKWNEYTFPEPIYVPSGFFIAISSSNGGFAGLGSDVPNDEYPFRYNTHYYTYDFTSGLYGDFYENMPCSQNAMIRAEGYNFGEPVKFDQMEQDIRINTAMEFQPVLVKSDNINTESTPCPPFVGAKGCSFDKVDELQGYSIYRLSPGEDENKWTFLEEINANETTITDHAWDMLDFGVYQYAVKAIYTTDLSVAAFSNMLPKVPYFNVTFIIVDKYNNPIEDATVWFHGVYLEGYTTIAAPGAYVYIVFKAGYTEIIGHVIVENDDVEVYIRFIGVSDNILETLVLYPNPFKNEIHISHPEMIKEVQITNVTGQKVKQVIFDGKSILTEQLAAGIYFVVVEGIMGDKKVFKMIK